MTNTTTLEEQVEAWYHDTNRNEKLEYLYETCSEDFIMNHLVQEMVTWMGEDDFDNFFRHLSRHWEIMTPPELDAAMNS